MIDKLIPNLSLAAKKAGIYSQVDGLSLQNLFYAYNEFFPNCYMFTTQRREGNYLFDTKKILLSLRTKYGDEKIETIQYITEDISKGETYMSFCILIPEKNIFARVERMYSESYILFDNAHYDDMIEFKTALLEYYLPEAEEKNNLFTISSNAHGFELIKNPIKEIKDFDVLKQYNDDFVLQDAKIQKFIKKDDTSGLIMLHGTKGTGKTTYIRHLINTNPDKRFVFVPAGLIELLGRPDFQSFLLSLTNHIIILEDCEPAIKDRKTNLMGSSAVSILLNMSDGLLSDGLGIKFICTFNADVKDMDEAITRKGRLAVKYEFKPLCTEKSNILLKEVYVKNGENEERFITLIDGSVEHYYFDGEKGLVSEPYDDVLPEHVDNEADIPSTDKPMTLADIYNYDDESYVTERKKII